MPGTKKTEEKTEERTEEKSEEKTEAMENILEESKDQKNEEEPKGKKKKTKSDSSEKKEKSLDSLKEHLKAKKESKSLLSLEEYVKSGIHLGTKVIMPDMRRYVYRRRADGIAILNTELIDMKLKEAIEFIKKFGLKEMILVCKREAGWKAAQLFSEVTGIKVFTKKYPAGIITNTKLNKFFEPELIIVCDPWLDKNAMNDAVKTNKKVLALCDTNNATKGADVIVPCNNKSDKSLGLILYLFARELVKFHDGKKEINLEDFTGDLSLEKKEKSEEETGEINLLTEEIKRETAEALVVNPEAQAF